MAHAAPRPQTRRNASPKGEARPKARAYRHRVGLTPEKLAQAADCEPCSCPLEPVEGTLHDLQRRVEGEDRPGEPPLPPHLRLAAWVLGVKACYHSWRPKLMKRGCGEREWLEQIARWADMLRRADPGGYRERPEPPPERLPMEPSARVPVYAARVRQGLAVFSPRDTVDVPAALAPPVLSPAEDDEVSRVQTLAEARARGAARGLRFRGAADA